MLWLMTRLACAQLEAALQSNSEASLDGTLYLRGLAGGVGGPARGSSGEALSKVCMGQ
jgi:hypothetical protein